MAEYDSKINRLREEIENEPVRSEKKVEKVVTTPVKPKKKSEIRKLADIFIAEDISSVKSYIISDIVIPTIKDAIEDVVHLLLRGDIDKGKRGTAASKVSYRSYYERERDRRDRDEPRVRGAYDYDQYTLGSRGEAEAVLSAMDEMIATYGVVSVADFYDLIGVSGNYTDNKYGWTNIRNADVVRVRDGYMIKFPKAMPLV